MTGLISDIALRRGIKSGLYRQTELGLEKRCSACGDYWPADPEFFYPKGGRLASQCKACFREINGREAAGIYREQQR